MAINSNNIIIGFIKNINKYGLAFQYIANTKILDGMLIMDIFHNSKDFYLKNVAFKTVSDFYIERESPFCTIVLRQCSGEFVNLTEYQKIEVERFIQKYTICET